MNPPARLLTSGLLAGLMAQAMAPAAATEQVSPPQPGVSALAPEGERSIGFAPATIELDAAGRQALAALAAKMRAAPGRQLAVTAYAGAPGGDEALARRMALGRAIAVRRFLIEQGVSSSRMAVRALGSRPGAGAPDRVDLRLVAP